MAHFQRQFELKSDRIEISLNEKSIEALKIVNSSSNTNVKIAYQLNGKIILSKNNQKASLNFNSYSFGTHFTGSKESTQDMHEIECPLTKFEDFKPDFDKSKNGDSNFFIPKINIEFDVIKAYLKIPDIRFHLTAEKGSSLESNILLSNFLSQKSSMASKWGILNQSMSDLSLNGNDGTFNLMLKEDSRVSSKTMKGVWVSDAENLCSAHILHLLIQFMNFKVAFEFDENSDSQDFLLCKLDKNGQHEFYKVTLFKTETPIVLTGSMPLKNLADSQFTFLMTKSKQFPVTKASNHNNKEKNPMNNFASNEKNFELAHKLEFILKKLDSLEAKIDSIADCQKELKQKFAENQSEFKNEKIDFKNPNNFSKEDEPEEFKTLIKGIKNILDSTPSKSDSEYLPQSIDMNDYGLASANLTIETKKYLDKLNINAGNDIMQDFSTSTKAAHQSPNLINRQMQNGKNFNNHSNFIIEEEPQSHILDIEKIRRLPKLT